MYLIHFDRFRESHDENIVESMILEDNQTNRDIMAQKKAELRKRTSRRRSKSTATKSPRCRRTKSVPNDDDSLPSCPMRKSEGNARLGRPRKVNENDSRIEPLKRASEGEVRRGRPKKINESDSGLEQPKRASEGEGRQLRPRRYQEKSEPIRASSPKKKRRNSAGITPPSKKPRECSDEVHNHLMINLPQPILNWIKTDLADKGPPTGETVAVTVQNFLAVQEKTSDDENYVISKMFVDFILKTFDAYYLKVIKHPEEDAVLEEFASSNLQPREFFRLRHLLRMLILVAENCGTIPYVKKGIDEIFLHCFSLVSV